MSSFSLNRRHKAGLFLVLVATGLSLFFEASAKQTAGIVLLGVAATWLFGSVSLRTLGFTACSLACAVGLLIAVVPLYQRWTSTIASGEEHDFAFSQIRQAVASAPVILPPPPGFMIEGFPPGAIVKPLTTSPDTLPADFFEKTGSPEKMTRSEFAACIKQRYPEYRDMEDAELVRRVLGKYPEYMGQLQKESAKKQISIPAKGFVVEPQSQRSVVFPAAAEKWLRPDGVIAVWVHVLKGTNVTVPFPGDASAEAIMAEFQTKHLLPRPTYSIAAAISANRGTVLSGVVLFALGLLGFAGMLWRERKAKQMATGLPG